jgi:hypothetical protein
MFEIFGIDRNLLTTTNIGLLSFIDVNLRLNYIIVSDGWNAAGVCLDTLHSDDIIAIVGYDAV